MTEQLLTTKFHSPRRRLNLVSCPRVIERLIQGVRAGYALMLLSAPPGFDKTTLLGEWIAQIKQRVAWLSLDVGDDDPARFQSPMCRTRIARRRTTMWYNPIMMWILRSPMHGMLSGNTMIITYTGRKSGKTFSTPVNYVRDGDVLWTVSFRHRTWWRNLHDSPVTVRIQGKDFSGVGKAITDQQEIEADLMAFLRKAPQIAKYIGVGLDASGQPRPQDIAEAAEARVMVRVQLSGS